VIDINYCKTQTIISLIVTQVFQKVAVLWSRKKHLSTCHHCSLIIIKVFLLPMQYFQLVLL